MNGRSRPGRGRGILLNRLLPRGVRLLVSAVVMDEFHSPTTRHRLNFPGLLPPHIRLLLLSATVGNAAEFSTG